MTTKVFDVIHPDFFKILSNPTKFEYAECLNLLYNALKDASEYTLLKSEATDILEAFFEEKRMNNENDIIQSSRERATAFLRDMHSSGWVDEEFEFKLYQVTISLTENAVQFLAFIESLKPDTELKYSSQIYSVFTSLKNFDIEKGELVIEDVYKNTQSFFDSLRRLNTSIKKYIQKIFDENITNDLSELFKILTGEYQLKIVDAAYYHLLTKDNPSQYTFTILDRIQDIVSDQEGMHVMAMRLSSDDDSYKENDLKLRTKLIYIYEQFNTIQDLIHEITIKNQTFVASAIGRIRFLLNETTDITGIINDTIKQLIQHPNFEIGGILNDVRILNDNSLATPRKKIIKEESYIEVFENSSNNISDVQDWLVELKRYSRRQIELIVADLLDGSKQVNMSDTKTLNATTVTLIFLYGYAYNSSYRVEASTKTYMNEDGKILGDFFIRRKDGQSISN